MLAVKSSREECENLMKGQVVRVLVKSSDGLEEPELVFDDGTAAFLFVSRGVGRLEVSRRRFSAEERGA